VNVLRGRAYYAVLRSAQMLQGAQMDGKSRGMYSPGETDSAFNAPVAVTHAAQGGTHASSLPEHSSHHIYDLRRGNLCSDSFYAELTSFCDRLLARLDQRTGVLLDGYSRHVRELLGEPPRSRGEYAIELLTVGMVLRRYESGAQNTPRLMAQLAHRLCKARTRWPMLKPLIDLARGAIARFCLTPNLERKIKSRATAVERLEKLAVWLAATGEFKQEALRVTNWRDYLARLNPDKATHWLQVARDLSLEFERDAAAELGAYTCGVDSFLNRLQTSWRWREDLLMCDRPESEYHLNMAAAEVMNRGLREEFSRTEKRVVLVPTCMRGARAASCKATVHGLDIQCTGCDPGCSVNRISRRMRGMGVKVYLVPHASGFSRWLDRWQRDKSIGVTAVACMLNILEGGYEMRARAIPSQCLPLDYPGCRKHWDRNGISTALNDERLAQLDFEMSKLALLGAWEKAESHLVCWIV
jgi:hypothetical protein